MSQSRDCRHKQTEGVKPEAVRQAKVGQELEGSVKASAGLQGVEGVGKGEGGSVEGQCGSSSCCCFPHDGIQTEGELGR
jgi:hypothetical protein